jgi:hypothetical protein
MPRFIKYVARSILRAQVVLGALIGFFAGMGLEQMFKGCP